MTSNTTSAKRGLSHSNSPDEAKKRQHFEFGFDRETLLSPDGRNLADTPPSVYLPLLFKMLDVMDSKMDTILASNEALQKEVADQAAKLAACDTKIVNQAKEISLLKDVNAKLNLQVDANEQHSRNECLVLHHIDEGDGESSSQALTKFVEIVKSKTGVELTEADIARAHRLGAKKEGHSRPIIARFKKMSTRNSVFRKKREFKNAKNSSGKSISLTENLTRLRLNVLSNARAKYGQFNAWSIEGRIYAMDNGKKIEVPIVI